MAFSLSSYPALQYSNPSVQFKCGSKPQIARHSRVAIINCGLKGSSPPEEGTGSSSSSDRNSGLKIGSPVIVIEAPTMIKTAASVPCLRVNSGLVNPGDVGRIVSRKPKDVWAVRLTIGTYLIDGKYFKPLELDE
ncbi:protein CHLORORESPIRATORY REDUCTION 42, chloroplastic [Rhododendron vialii]|uniref:protein CHLORORESPIRATORY REDUCTION 42, chloroplastic n=1 Tax=Rhododendron vialii TaxID=182163 RepID=UPI00265DC170|nr:protein CHLORORESPIRATORY REDUCTION 42, chloroplastic [Rhododendron vialii]